MVSPRNPQFKQRIIDNFEMQPVMRTLGARLESVEPGKVEISLPFRADLTQQHGFLHAGITTTVLDSAAGYAAFSLMPAEAEVLSIEFKTNLLAPAIGERLIARGEVIKAGRTVSVVQAYGYMVKDGEEKLVATFNGSMMAVTGRSDIKG